MRLMLVFLFAFIPISFVAKGRSVPVSFKVPVLCYHQVSEKGKGRFNIDPAVFEQHMRYLFLNGYTVISLDRLVSFLRSYHAGKAGRIFLPRKPVVITFDDNYPSIYKVAYPILKKYRFAATNFLYARFMTARNWRLYRKALRAGLSLHSHTLNHVDLTKKLRSEDSKEYKKRIFKEIYGSRKLLSRVLRSKVRYLAYPYGLCNKLVVRFSRLAGYTAMFSALGGYVNEKTGLDAIPRFTMFKKFDMSMFKRIVSGRWYAGLGTYKRGVRPFSVRDYNFDF